MAAFNKFNLFVDALALKKVNLNTDSLKIMLTNTAPVSTNAVYTDVSGAELANGAGYLTGGTAIGSSSATNTTGTEKLLGNAVVFTASGSMGPFRYAIIYSNTATNKDLIGWFDYGSSITLAANETFTVNSAANGNWDATNPILTIA